jgi:hypothetical protein
MTEHFDASDKQVAIETLLSRLEKAEHVLATKKATAGFDGFVDTIVRIIKKKKEGKSPTFFRTKEQFGEYIIEKEGTSFSLELEEKSARIGGNMPILSHALGTLGIQVNCIGALGYPKTAPIFRKLSPRCHIYSFADPGTSTALEFEDGKILLGQMGELNSLGWKEVKDKLGLDTIISLFKESQLLCMVNWSEILSSTDIWKGLLQDVFPNLQGMSQAVFIDLSDCSQRSDESILEALYLIREISKNRRVTLGLNRNESNRLYETLFKKKPKKDFTHVGEKLYSKLDVEVLVLHSSAEAHAFDYKGSYQFNTFFIENPTILTGAGDNFNAGFCAGLMLDLDPRLSIILGHTVAGLFIEKGKSPQLFDVNRFLYEQLKK